MNECCRAAREEVVRLEKWEQRAVESMDAASKAAGVSCCDLIPAEVERLEGTVELYFGKLEELNVYLTDDNTSGGDWSIDDPLTDVRELRRERDEAREVAKADLAYDDKQTTQQMRDLVAAERERCAEIAASCGGSGKIVAAAIREGETM